MGRGERYSTGWSASHSRNETLRGSAQDCAGKVWYSPRLITAGDRTAGTTSASTRCQVQPSPHSQDQQAKGLIPFHAVEFVVAEHRQNGDPV